MENFIFSLNATAPIFLVMILGNILMKTGFLSEEFTRVSDKFVFKVALPALLFYDISTADMRDVFNLKFILFCMFTTIIMFLVIWILTWIFMKDKSMVGAFVQASARGSAAILGMAFVQNIYGDSGMAPLMIVSAVPFYNIFSVVILTFHSRDQIGLDKKAQIRRACINVAKNPIILGILVMARPTMSLALWYQIVGRAIRPHPSKEAGWIVDLCGNKKRFGEVKDLRLVDSGNGKWAVYSNNRQLTNVRF